MAVIGCFRITCKQLNSTVSSTIRDAKGLLALTSEVMHELLGVGYITSIMTKGLFTNGGIHRLRKGNRRR